MKIEIDARFLTNPQAGGFKTSTENLVRALSQVDKNNKYDIYVDRPFASNQPYQANLTYKVVDGMIPGKGMPLREQILSGKQVNEDEPDIVHYLCSSTPMGP